MEAVLSHDPVEALWAQARDNGWPVVVDPLQAYRHQDLRDFVDLWQSKAIGGVIPRRSALSARELKPLLSRIILCERVDGPRYRVRLMGTSLAPIWSDMTGKYFDQALPPQLQARWSAVIDGVLAAGGPVRLMSRVDYEDKNFLVAELAAVPLADETGRPTMVMGAIHASADRSWQEVAKVVLAN